MSFSSGTADTREQLLDLFRAFAVTSGWTVDRFADSGTGKVLNIHKTSSYGDTMYASLRSVNNENLPGALPTFLGIAASMSDGYDAAKDCVDQPGAPVNVNNAGDFYATYISPFTAVAKYWFFSATTPRQFLAMVIMLPDGTFRHLLFSELERLDTGISRGYGFWSNNGGTIPGSGATLPFEGSVNDSESWHNLGFLRLFADERNGWWGTGKWNTSSYYGLGAIFGANFRDKNLIYNSLNQFSNSAGLCPVNLYARLQTGKCLTLGHLPFVRTSRRLGFLVDQERPLGSDVWMGFPSFSQTGDYAIVYKKVT